MTNATVKPINTALEADAPPADDIAELLSTLADLAHRVSTQRARVDALARQGDERVREAAAHLAQLELNTRAVHGEAARVHNELQHARLI